MHHFATGIDNRLFGVDTWGDHQPSGARQLLSGTPGQRESTAHSPHVLLLMVEATFICLLLALLLKHSTPVRSSKLDDAQAAHPSITLGSLKALLPVTTLTLGLA